MFDWVSKTAFTVQGFDVTNGMIVVAVIIVIFAGVWHFEFRDRPESS